ncbi:MAG: TonB-dependent receptor [Caulobacteraceae bacterium]|nr:TonB-dependent receptor [Caulobacteraceae bacterium]
MKASYMISCAVAALVSGGFGVGAAAAADQAGSAAVASTAASTTAVGEVIVTAQRRSENIQKVPMTVQAMTGETLSKLNVTTFNDILRYTPNVTYASNGPGQGNIFMRGLSAGFVGNQSSATIASFPNVALYLDDQSMQFPSRNADIYMVDMERVEVLEGPQGTLFGGGAEAGALRYITNKPKLNAFSGDAEGMYGLTAGGGQNASGHITLNLPIVKDKLAARVVVYDEHQGGYIDNVRSTFTRSNLDLGNYYFGISPVAGKCPNGGAPGSAGCTIVGAPGANNYAIAGKDSNPVDYQGARLSVLWEVNPDWDVLITESLQNMNAQGISAEYPTGSDFQTLKPLQITAFVPSYDKDRLENTAWTVNGKIGPLKAIYTGGYTVRNISQQADYTNYSRSGGGMYYECVGGSTGWGTGAPSCYSPIGYWHDEVRNTHLSNEVRISSPDDWRLRFIVGAYQEQYRIYDVMNFDYKTIPSCTPANLAAAQAGGPICIANVMPAPGTTMNDPHVRGDSTGFGEDTQRGYDQYAVFGSVDFDLIPNVLTLTAGTRWYQYNEFEVGSQYSTGTGCMNVANGTCLAGLTDINAEHYKTSYSGFKSRFNLTWHVNDDTLTYFTYSQGFRPGGFNRSNSKKVLDDANGNPQYHYPGSYAPDSLTNYEIGLKTSLLDRRLQLNLSAYYMQWDNVQFFLFDPPFKINTTFGINGPSYDVKGVEAQVAARVTHNLTIQASGSYNDDSQTTSPCLIGNIPGSPSFGKCITEAVPRGGSGPVPFTNPFGDVGSVPAFSPKFEGNIRARYEWTVQDYDAFVQVGGNYVGSMWNQPASYSSGVGVVIPNTVNLRFKQPAYATLDASIGISKDNWHVELYGSNLTNSHASTFTSTAQFIKSEVPLRPAVVGLKVGSSF